MSISRYLNHSIFIRQDVSYVAVTIYNVVFTGRAISEKNGAKRIDRGAVNVIRSIGTTILQELVHLCSKKKKEVSQ